MFDHFKYHQTIKVKPPWYSALKWSFSITKPPSTGFMLVVIAFHKDKSRKKAP